MRKVTPADVASLRLLSVLFAAAASALTAIWALRLLASRVAAALAGSLVALGSLPAEYAEQLRAYAVVVLVSAAFGMLLAEAAHRPRHRWLVALAAATWLGTLTHYFFFFVVAAAVWAAGQPIFDERNMLPVASFLAILVAAGVTALPVRLVPVAAATGVVAALAGAAYAQVTLGRVAYDSVAHALTELGWSAREPLIVDYPTAAANRRGVGIQITSAASWYLPGRPGARVGARLTELPRPLRDRAVGRSGSWLAHYRGRVSATRVFTFYDHSILGRPRGRIVLVRFSAPTRVPGVLYYALTPRGRSARAAACASR